jgi:hypothetical protein
MNELTQKEIQDLLVLLDRVTVTGRAEAIALLQISQKLEGQLQELLNPQKDDKN